MALVTFNHKNNHHQPLPPAKKKKVSIQKLQCLFHVIVTNLKFEVVLPPLPYHRLEVMKAYNGEGAKGGRAFISSYVNFIPHQVKARWGREGVGWSWAGWLRTGLGGWCIFKIIKLTLSLGERSYGLFRDFLLGSSLL